MTVYELHHPEREAIRHWGGGLKSPHPPRNLKITEGGMPEPDYPLPTHARRLVEALHAAGKMWELTSHEHERRVEVRHYRPDEWPIRIDWQWIDGRRTRGPAVADSITELSDSHPH